MAKKNKITLQFKGFEEYAEKLDKLGGDLKAITEKALQNSQLHIGAKLHRQMKQHHRSGNTEKEIIENEYVHWEGSVASVGIGFFIPEGLPSIFLMYGTPRMKKDQNLYNSIYGSKTKKEIAELQEKTFARAIQKIMGG